MAVILEITKQLSKKKLLQKVAELNSHAPAGIKKLDAKKFTGRVKSFGDGVLYQKKMRDEWE